MIPAMIASVLILYWCWRENQPKSGEPAPDSAESLRRQVTELNARLDGIRDRLGRK